MSDPEQGDAGAVQFAWGKQRGRGKEMSVQFYGSFTYDGVEYSLYDCVYLHKEGEPEPFIGKLIKIWEQKGNRKRVKVLWFFRPVEIRNFLAKYDQPLEKELFLACGEGIGLSDVNPLESIGGKCNVICTSKDKRNRQPSDEELRAVDYIFYRTFDVGTCTVSDKFGEAIAGVQAKYIFNSTEEGLTVHAALQRPRANGVSEISSRSADPVQETDLGAEKNRPVEKPVSSGGPGAGSEVMNSSTSGTLNGRSSEKMRLMNASGTEEDVRSSSADKVIQKLDSDFSCLDSESAGKSKPARANISSEETLRVSTTDSSLRKRKDLNKMVEMPRRPGAETSKWFTGLPWETRIEEARARGTIVLLENLDPCHTSEEIEDLIYHFFKKQCTARVIEWSMFSSPYHGRALVICKSRGDAEEMVKKLEENVLMLSNSRPLIARMMAGRRQDSKFRRFYGHYVLEKTRRREGASNEASTSHRAQANTLEFEMALDWVLLHDKSAAWWRALHEEHDKETRQMRLHRPAAEKPPGSSC